MKQQQKALIRWYEKNYRDLPWRKTKDAYSIWISEIMLQQTTVATVKDYYLKFIRLWPTIQNLSCASEEDVLRDEEVGVARERGEGAHVGGTFSFLASEPAS